MSLNSFYLRCLSGRFLGRCREACPAIGFDLLLAFALLLALVLAGCGTARISTTVQSDGSGVRRVAVSMDKRMYHLLALEGHDPLASLTEQAVAGATSEPFGGPGQQGAALNMPFDAVSALNQGPGAPGLEQVQLTRSGPPLLRTFEYTAHIDTNALPTALPGLLPGVVTSAEGAMLDYEVTLPGEILAHNADEVYGTTLVWHLPVFPGAVYDLQATSQQHLSTPLLVGMAGLWAVLFVLLIIAVFLLVRSLRERQA